MPVATFPYQTASGKMTTVGPCSHWSRQPFLLARTRDLSPRFASPALKRLCSEDVSPGLQHPLGFSGGRWLVQTKMCFSNLDILLRVYRKCRMSGFGEVVSRRDVACYV